tara:strand:+ start:108 stop:482 length:375 start_codon:yes stop_codon:yes gene_type:complete
MSFSVVFARRVSAIAPSARYYSSLRTVQNRVENSSCRSRDEVARPSQNRQTADNQQPNALNQKHPRGDYANPNIPKSIKIDGRYSKEAAPPQVNPKYYAESSLVKYAIAAAGGAGLYWFYLTNF